MVCEKCGKIFNKEDDWRKDKTRELRFCSKKCSASRQGEKKNRTPVPFKEIGCCKCGKIIKVQLNTGKNLCEECYREKNRIRARNRLKENPLSPEPATERRRQIKKIAVDYKGGKCQFCGYDKCFGSMHFHHLNPKEKDFSLSKKGGNKKWETVKIELDKCILVCANCHGEIHSGLIKNPTSSQ